MYTLADYVAMIADRSRTEAHLAAMRQLIRPGDVVLELGTGFGYFAVQAALLGAGHVYAIEPEDAVALGPALATANGVGERVTFLPGYSTRIELPQRAHLLIEDMRGASPLFAGRLSALLDARDRLLRPDARIIPRRDFLQLTPATAPAALDAGVRSLAEESHGVELASVLARVGTGWRQIRAGDATPLAPTITWTEIDYAEFASLNVEGTATAVVETAGRLDGFVSSFEAELAPGVRYSTAPGAARMVYDAGWFPLAEPVDVRPGDHVAVRMRAVHDGVDYIWAWETTVIAGDGRFAERHQKQNNLSDILLSPERRCRRESGFVADRTADLEQRQRALELVDGRRTVGEIANEIRAQYPSHFTDARAALRAVAEWLAEVEESTGP